MLGRGLGLNRTLRLLRAALSPSAADVARESSSVAAGAKAGQGESLLSAYNRLLHEHPYSTKAIGTAVTYSLSDAVAQWIEEQGTVGDAQSDRPSLRERLERNAKFSAVGLLWVGPLLTYWFNVMDRVVPGKSPRAVGAKLVADQVLQGPFMIGTMYLWTSLLSGYSLRQARDKVDRELWNTWVNSVIVWGPVQILQQAVVPLHYRVLVANFVSFFWDTYLSLKMMNGCKAETRQGARIARKATVTVSPSIIPSSGGSRIRCGGSNTADQPQKLQ